MDCIVSTRWLMLTSMSRTVLRVGLWRGYSRVIVENLFEKPVLREDTVTYS